jgi:sigma 54 modulation/S30EA-like ribosomal protein
MHRVEAIAPLELRVELTGELPSGAYAIARKKIAATTLHAHEPVRFARVRVTRNPDPSDLVIAQANLDIDGRLVRTQVAAPTMCEAVDLLAARLQTRLELRALRWDNSRHGRVLTGASHEWRPDASPVRRPPYFPRPPQDRKIVRHKAVRLARCTVDEAAAAMADRDYDFHLFTECDTGQDSILYHAGPAGHRLAQLNPDRYHLAPATLPLTISEAPAPLLSTAGAVNRLTHTDRAFVFFLDADRCRGAVLYRRYDGHYGLLTPAAG